MIHVWSQSTAWIEISLFLMREDKPKYLEKKPSKQVKERTRNSTSDAPSGSWTHGAQDHRRGRQCSWHSTTTFLFYVMKDFQKCSAILVFLHLYYLFWCKTSKLNHESGSSLGLNILTFWCKNVLCSLSSRTDPRPYNAILAVPFCKRIGEITMSSTEAGRPK